MSEGRRGRVDEQGYLIMLGEKDIRPIASFDRSHSANDYEMPPLAQPTSPTSREEYERLCSSNPTGFSPRHGHDYESLNLDLAESQDHDCYNSDPLLSPRLSTDPATVRPRSRSFPSASSDSGSPRSPTSLRFPDYIDTPIIQLTRKRLSDFTFMPMIPEEASPCYLTTCIPSSTHPKPPPPAMRTKRYPVVESEPIRPTKQPPLTRKKLRVMVLVVAIIVCLFVAIAVGYHFLVKTTGVPPDCHYSAWRPWSECSATSRCAVGSKTRLRDVTHSTTCRHDPTLLSETQYCSYGHCNGCAFYLADHGTGSIWYFTDEKNASLTEVFHAATVATHPHSVAYDAREELLLWIEDTNSVVRTLDLTNPENLRTMSSFPMRRNYFQALAVDVAQKLVFITDRRGGIIRVSYNQTDVQRIVVESFRESPAVVLDEENRQVYWLDSGKNTLETASYSGLNRRTIISDTGGVGQGTGLALDKKGGRLFWILSKQGEIRSVPVDGSNRDVAVLVTSSFPETVSSLAICQDHIFVSHSSPPSIHQVSLSGGPLKEVLFDERLKGPLYLTIV